MDAVYVAWIISALVLIIIAMVIGQSSKKTVWGILVDTNNKFSLSQLQTVLWTIVVLSLIVGVFVARLVDEAAKPLDFEIPHELLTLMGITYGSTVLAGITKAGKEPDAREKPKFSQFWTVEEGAGKDKDADITRFQNILGLVIVAVAYIVAVVAEFNTLGGSLEVTKLPTLDSSWVTLMGISYAAYIVGKVPPRK